MPPALAALIFGAILLVAGIKDRNIIDVALGRESTKDPEPNPIDLGASDTAPAGPAGPAGVSGDPVDVVVSECERIDALGLKYVWGGGHAGYNSADGPFDCSGAVSYVLHAAGLLKGPPRVSGMLAVWASPGQGKRLTIYANVTHVFLEVDGKFWGTSHENPGGGPGWHSPRDTSKFSARHHAGT